MARQPRSELEVRSRKLGALRCRHDSSLDTPSREANWPLGSAGRIKKKAAEVRNPGGAWRTNRCRSALDGVAAFPVVALGGGHGQPHLLPDRPGQESAHRMRLPSGSFLEFFGSGAAGPLQQVEDLGGLAALPEALGLRRRGFLGSLLRGGMRF